MRKKATWHPNSLPDNREQWLIDCTLQEFRALVKKLRINERNDARNVQ